jgi:hypothetical protein
LPAEKRKMLAVRSMNDFIENFLNNMNLSRAKIASEILQARWICDKAVQKCYERFVINNQATS